MLKKIYSCFAPCLLVLGNSKSCDSPVIKGREAKKKKIVIKLLSKPDLNLTLLYVLNSRNITTKLQLVCNVSLVVRGNVSVKTFKM